MMDDLYEEIRRRIDGVVRRNEPMAKHTSFGIGGPVDIWVEPEHLRDLFVLTDICKERRVACLVVGRGSNLLVGDGGIRGVVINLNQACNRLERKKEAVIAGAGVSLLALAKFALHHGLQGLEFCVGIPGSVGGALATNAGAWGSSIADVVQSVLVYDPGNKEKKWLEKESIKFDYRRSNIAARGIVLEAEFHLRLANPDEISTRMNHYISQRTKSQPLQARSAGSIFKNPPGQYAGAIIERLGLKGRKCGGAAVSEKHANFIVNTGNASAADVLNLINEIKRRAQTEMQVELEEEITTLGEA
ncbi:MAG: UDP-N-acetylmuramate dehydrogenase [Candidatus Abyssobacteria bacterium SURF_5]|uniref:UDP-N-acetylenolpyruvoylglucosamine reductase n=1 Tax=Abyssobacteria bacterium (strain SURF_5) TaxID=2093360 RepID=A0A3A4P1W7_ABYX5|nr:MAG: UDP-N-acetylmuramate dehydrogenase [Candidatus Abyssubacteria bacterium SURF_5]